MIGALIADEYELLELLGEGAAGSAYKARRRPSGELVALKLLHAQLDSDIELQKRFVREVSVLERLHHPNIVAHRGCGLHEGKLYLAMELVDSGTLDKVLKQRGSLPWRPAVEAALQVCGALAHAHAQGVIHRDLKPANLFLSTDGRVKVGDFGLARDLNQHRLTVEGQTVGSVRFMAPEQVQGKDELACAVDLYALGCLLFQMISGDPPYDGATIVEVFEKHLFGDIPKLSDRVASTPGTLDAVLSQLLAKDPADRPADADAAAALLEAVLEGEPLTGDGGAGSTPTLTQQLVATPAPSKPNLALAGIVLAAMAAFGLVAWLVAGGG